MRADIYEATADDDSPPQCAVAENLLSNAASVALRVYIGDKLGGYFLCLFVAPEIYQVHTMLLDNCRGRDGIRAGILGARWMFLNTDCTLLISEARSHRPEVLLFAHEVGFQNDWVINNAAKVGGVSVNSTMLSLSLHEWVRREWSEVHFASCGRLFHKQFFLLVGELHAEDVNHDGMVGICLRMAVYGQQPDKAVMLFNRWAATAGYRPVFFRGLRGDKTLIQCGTTPENHAVVAVDKNFNLTLICQSGPQVVPQP